MNLPDGFLLQDNKYRITNTIGQGGFGITYIAVWNTEVKGGLGTMKTEIPVCIKEYFFKDYCYREDDSLEVKIHSRTGAELFNKFKEKLIKEANILSAVHHPYIVNVLEVFEENNTAYIVMEYISGYSLKYMLDREGALSENKALKYVHQVGNALGFVHEKNIVHLDIKPSNIIVDKDDNARLIDFGVSKRYDMEQNETTTTTLTLSRGFASIEQYDDEGTQNFSPCPDIYSLGATMYNLLTGIVPIESILRAAKEMLPPTYYNSNISEKTEKAVLKAMELKPADRFQTMKEMLAALNTPSCELSENQYSDEKKPFVGNNFDKHTPITSSHQSEEEDEDRTILALMPPEGSTGTIKNHERGKKKKSNQQKIFSAVAIFICAIACYTLYGYFADDDLAKGFINLQHADTLPASNKIANANIMKFKKLNDFESENDGPKETAVEKKDEKDNSRFVSVISEKTDEKNKHVKTPEKEEEKDFTSYSAQQDTIRREKEYSDYMASAQTNFDEKKYSEADADIRKALKAKYTDKAYELSNKIKEKREETSVEERLAKYRRLTSFGNNLRVVKNGEDKYGAINRSGKEVVVCKYKGTTYYKNGRAFLREDDKYDLYDNNGDLVQEGLPKPSID